MALINRRSFVSSVALARPSILARGASQPALWAQRTTPALVTSDRACPSLPYGVASGDVTSDAAISWNRINKPSHMLVEYGTRDSLRRPAIFGMVTVGGTDEVLAVSLHNLRGEKLYSIDLSPAV